MQQYILEKVLKVCHNTVEQPCFKVMQLDEEEVKSFNHLLEALNSGAPPHAGIALGLLLQMRELWYSY